MHDILLIHFITIFPASFTEWLLKTDRALFTFIHATASYPSLDWLMKGLRNALTWIPLYAFVLYWIIRNHKRYAWQFILGTLVVFAITDYSSASIFKPFFQRLRPCYEPGLRSVIRDLVGCGGQFGMPSSHASNHFGMAAFWFYSIRWMDNRSWWWLWIWAAVIGYAQVYVGKHYPGDILAGALLGTSVGLLVAALMKKWLTHHRDPANRTADQPI